MCETDSFSLQEKGVFLFLYALRQTTCDDINIANLSAREVIQYTLFEKNALVEC